MGALTWIEALQDQTGHWQSACLLLHMASAPIDCVLVICMQHTISFPSPCFPLKAVCMGHYLMMAPLAKTMALVLTAALPVAAVIVTTVYSIVFPEYCTDMVSAAIRSVYWCML